MENLAIVWYEGSCVQILWKLTHFISNCLIRSFESWECIAGCYQCNLNGACIWVHRIRYWLATQPEWTAAIIWRNIRDYKTGATKICAWTICVLTFLLSEIQEGQLDSPTWNCDSPNTYLLWINVVWKVGAWDKSTWWPADGNSTNTGYNIQFEKRKTTISTTSPCIKIIAKEIKTKLLWIVTVILQSSVFNATWMPQ